MRALVVAIVFGLVGAVASVFGAYSYVSTKDWIARSAKAEAVVTENIAVRDDKNKVAYAPVYKFATADGKEIVAQSSSSSNPASYAVGERLTVLYDPAIPTSVSADSFLDLWLLPTILLGIGAPLLLGSIAFFALLLLAIRRG